MGRANIKHMMLARFHIYIKILPISFRMIVFFRFVVFAVNAKVFNDRINYIVEMLPKLLINGVKCGLDQKISNYLLN